MRSKERPIDLLKNRFKILHLRCMFVSLWVSVWRLHCSASCVCTISSKLCVYFCTLQYEEFRSEKLLSLLPTRYTYLHTTTTHANWYCCTGTRTVFRKKTARSVVRSNFVCEKMKGEERKQNKNCTVFHAVGQSFVLEFIVHFALTILPLL